MLLFEHGTQPTPPGVSIVSRPTGDFLRWKDIRTQRRREQRLPDGMTRKEQTQAAIQQKAKLDAIARRVATGEVREIGAGVDLVAEWVSEAPSPQTAKNRHQTAVLLYKLKETLGGRQWDELVLDDLIRFRRIVGAASCSAGSTKNLRLQQARSFFSYLRRLGHRLFIDDSTVADCLTKFKEDPHRSGELLSPAQLQNLFLDLHKKDPQLGLFALICVTTGLRISEAISIKGQDFVFESGKAPVLRVHASKTGQLRNVSLKASPLATMILVGLKSMHGDGLLFRPESKGTPQKRYDSWAGSLRRTFNCLPKSLRSTNSAYLAKTSHFSSIFAVAQNLGHGVTVAQKSYVAAANLLEIEQGETVEGIAQIETIGRAIMQKCGLDLQDIERQIKKTHGSADRDFEERMWAQLHQAFGPGPLAGKNLAEMAAKMPEIRALFASMRRRGFGNEHE